MIGDAWFCPEKKQCWFHFSPSTAMLAHYQTNICLMYNELYSLVIVSTVCEWVLNTPIYLNILPVKMCNEGRA